MNIIELPGRQALPMMQRFVGWQAHDADQAAALMRVRYPAYEIQQIYACPVEIGEHKIVEYYFPLKND